MQVKAIVTRKNISSVEVQVVDGHLHVIAPVDMPQSTLSQLLITNKDWYKHKLAINKVKQATNDANKLCSNYKTEFGNVVLASDMFAFKRVLIFGKIFEVVGGDVSKTILADDKVVVDEKIFTDASKRKKAIISLLKLLAKECLRQEISQFGTSIALCPSAINVTTIKNGGWIRCSDMQNRVVSIDYRAIQLPFKLRNYLIAHLFSHFFKKGHDLDFFAVLSNYLPDFTELQNRLDDFSFVKEIV